MGGGNPGIKSRPPVIHRSVDFQIQRHRLGSESHETSLQAALWLAGSADLNDGDNVDSLAKCIGDDVIPRGR